MYPLSTETHNQGPYKTQTQGPNGPCLEFSCIIFSGHPIQTVPAIPT